MAKNGFKIIDAELHVMEPVDLWEKYIDSEFKDRAPRRLNERRWDIRTVVEGDVMASMTDYNWPARSTEEEETLAERYAEEIAANFDPASQVRAMDREGLGLGGAVPDFRHVHHGPATVWTRGLPRPPAVPTNNWLYDYIQAADPSPDVRRGSSFSSRCGNGSHRGPSLRKRVGVQVGFPSSQHVQQPVMARPALRPFVDRSPGPRRPGGLS